MEQRQIYVVNTIDNSKKTIMSEAETLADLKADLTANGINHEGLVFTEGLSGRTFTSDDEPLPRNQMHDGNRTNNLVIALTSQKTKIKNGAPLSRVEAYDIIKKDNLQDKVYAAYGKNFTNCSTAELVALLEGEGYGLNEVPQYGMETKQEEAKDEVPNWLKNTDIDSMIDKAKQGNAVEEEESSSTINDDNDLFGIVDDIEKELRRLEDIDDVIQEITNGIQEAVDKVRDYLENLPQR